MECTAAAIRELRQSTVQRLLTKSGRGLPLVLAKGAVESAQAPEACCERDLGHRHVGRPEQSRRDPDAPPLRERRWRAAFVLREEPREVARPYAELAGKFIHGPVVQKSRLDESLAAPDRRQGADPCGAPRLRFRPAALASPEAVANRPFRVEIERHMIVARVLRRTDRAAENPRGRNSHEENAVEPPVSPQARAVADVPGQRGNPRSRPFNSAIRRHAPKFITRASLIKPPARLMSESGEPAPRRFGIKARNGNANDGKTSKNPIG
jgi:hypothetical protein